MSADFEPVPARYRGVWKRTLLQTPSSRDETTFVRWMQTSSWHADLRVPLQARSQPASSGPTSDIASDDLRLALQQGFCGQTSVTWHDGAERCTWHRHRDFQPPGPNPDTGRVEFDGPDRMVEYGVHGDYLEIWDRLPDSTGRFAVLVQLADRHATRSFDAALLIAGRFAMRVRPRTAAWPADTTTADSLADLVRRHPTAAAALLDFEISFGAISSSGWSIDRSTLLHREGTARQFRIERRAADSAIVTLGAEAAPWRIVEWTVDGDEIA